MDAHTLDLSVLPAERRRFLAGVGPPADGAAPGPARGRPQVPDPADAGRAVRRRRAGRGAAAVRPGAVRPGVGRAGAADRGAGRARPRRGGPAGAAGRHPAHRPRPGRRPTTRSARGCAGTSATSGCGRRGTARRERLPRDHGHLAMMDASMSYLRQFVPDVLAAVRFAGGPGTDDLLQAVGILAGLYAARARKVPDGAPDGFVPARWAGYLEKAAKDGDVIAYRHYWELCVLMALRDGLRSGDVYVPGSRRYADPASFLLTPQQWEPQRLEFCHLVGKPAIRGRRPGPGERRAARRAGRPGGTARPAAAGGRGPARRRRGTDHPAADRRGRPGRGRGAARRARRDAAPRPDRLGAGRGRRPHRVHRPPGARGRQGQPARRS